MEDPVEDRRDCLQGLLDWRIHHKTDSRWSMHLDCQHLILIVFGYDMVQFLFQYSWALKWWCLPALLLVIDQLLDLYIHLVVIGMCCHSYRCCYRFRHRTFRYWLYQLFRLHRRIHCCYNWVELHCHPQNTVLCSIINWVIIQNLYLVLQLCLLLFVVVVGWLGMSDLKM